MTSQPQGPSQPQENGAMGEELPAEVVEALVGATTVAVEELCQTPVIPGAAYHAGSLPSAAELVATVELKRSVPGWLAVGVPRTTARTLAQRYLADSPQPDDGLMLDAVGEFANVIAGQIKTMLKGTAYHFQLTTPRFGAESLPDSHEASKAWLVHPFATDAGEFVVCLRLSPCEDA